MKDMYLSHFAPIQNFFIPNFTNSARLQTGGITVYLGLIQSILLISFFLSFIGLKDQRFQSFINNIFSLILIMYELFFMQPISSPIWERVKTLRMFQFPWRLLSIVGLGTALLGAIIVFKNKKLNLIIISCFSVVSVISTIVFWNPPLGYDKIIESDYWNYPLNTTYFGETDLIWSDGPASSYPIAPFEIIEGEGEITNPYKKASNTHLPINAQTPVRMIDNTQYFPGWRVFVDSVKTPIEFQDQNHRGRITFNVPEGLHKVEVIFGNSPIRTIGNTASILTLLSSTIVYIIFQRKRL